MRSEVIENLNREFYAVPAGVLAPYYYRYLGYAEDMNARPPMFRANAIYSLFTKTTPVILKNEWIAGNIKSLYVEEDPLVLACAKDTVQFFGARNFATNKDHYAPNYRRVLSVGLPAMLEEIDASLEKHKEDSHRAEVLTAMRHTLCGFIQMLNNYADAAESHKGEDGYDDEKLDFIAKNCRAIAKDRPKSFAEALQLTFLCHTAFLMEERYAMALGRIDQYLYPFYKADIESGAITDERVTELLENAFIKLQKDIVNICIGGKDVAGNCQINGLSWCVLRAVGNCNVPGPNLSLRLTENTPDEFLDECLRIIGTGLGYPALMNDEVNLAALKKYGYADEDVHDYCMVGCIENFISGKQPPWSDNGFIVPRYLDLVLNNGLSHTSHMIGLKTGECESIDSMDALMVALEKQIAFGVDVYCASLNQRNDSINQRHYPEPFLSLFCDDCIGRGLDINDGGAIYPSVHGAGMIGVATMVDSLAAIEKVVFEDKEATLAQLRDAVNANFEGYEELREKLLAAPKYGNNSDFADKYAVWFMDYIPSRYRLHTTRDGGGVYTAAASNVNNIGAGRGTNATPDGRLRGEPLSDAASPTYGRDVRGATSAFNSLSKPDYTNVACGTVVNQKYSPSMFEGEKLTKLRTLIRTYFKKGGQEVQINATSREVLLDAMEHPENYRNLVVRVSGFSAFYVTLAREVQLDILNRTQQE